MMGRFRAPLVLNVQLHLDFAPVHDIVWNKADNFVTALFEVVNRDFYACCSEFSAITEAHSDVLNV